MLRAIVQSLAVTKDWNWLGLACLVVLFSDLDARLSVVLDLFLHFLRHIVIAWVLMVPLGSFADSWQTLSTCLGGHDGLLFVSLRTACIRAVALG